MGSQPDLWEVWKELSELDTLEKVSIFAIINGIIIGIIIATGFDVSPEGVIQYALSAIVGAFSSLLGFWVSLIVGAGLTLVFAIYGILGWLKAIQIATIIPSFKGFLK